MQDQIVYQEVIMRDHTVCQAVHSGVLLNRVDTVHFNPRLVVQAVRDLHLIDRCDSFTTVIWKRVISECRELVLVYSTFRYGLDPVEEIYIAGKLDVSDET